MMNKEKFIRKIFYNVLLKNEFVRRTTTIDPYFYAEIAARATYKSDKLLLITQELVKGLFESKNPAFFRELKESWQYAHSQKEHRILTALVGDLRVFKINHLWQPAGDAGKHYLSRLDKDHFLFQEYDGVAKPDTEFWQLPITNIIQLFNVVVTKHIKEGGKHHMWLFYYARFADILIRQMPKRSDEVKWEREYPTNSMFLISHYLIWNLDDWLDLCYEVNNAVMVDAIVDCWAQIIVSVNNSQKIGLEFKIRTTEIFLQAYCENYFPEISTEEEDRHPFDNTATAMQIRESFEKYIKHPPFGNKNVQYAILKKTWEQFDTLGFDDNEATKRLRGIIDGLEFDH